MWIEQPTRRQMLQRMCAGFGMVGLAGMLPKIAAAGGLGPIAHFAPLAKRVIFLFMNGGPSHVDTFDPKPGLMKFEGKQPEGKKTKGSGFMPSPLKFNRCGRNGIEISETLPNIGSMITADMAVEKLVANIHNPYLSRPQQRKQLDLLEKMNQEHLRARAGDLELEGQIKTMETAFAMQSEAMTTFDISREDEKTREM